MTTENLTDICLNLIDRCETAMVGTIDSEGYPEIRAMLNMEHDGLKEFWFSTNTSSRKISQIDANPKGCVYFVDTDEFRGVTLVGDFEILHDTQSKQKLWREGFEKYYPQGVTDPDYCVLHFTAVNAEHYHKLKTTRFVP